MHPPSIWAVLPVKHLAYAKSRLARCLGDHREAFATSLMLHTLGALTGTRAFGGILVVTPDTRMADLATAQGAAVAADHGTCLNDACSLGLARSRAAGADITVFVHADLPLLRAEDVIALLESYHSACAEAKTPLIGLLRCKDGDGTNMVVCGSDMAFVPHFGPNSFAAHAAAAPHCELVNANAAFDVDTEADVATLLACRHAVAPEDPIARILADDAVRADILQRCTSSESPQTRSHLLGKQF